MACVVDGLMLRKNLGSIGPETTELTCPMYLFLDIVKRSVWCTTWMKLYPLIQINIGGGGAVVIGCRRSRPWPQPFLSF